MARAHYYFIRFGAQKAPGGGRGPSIAIFIRIRVPTINVVCFAGLQKKKNLVVVLCPVAAIIIFVIMDTYSRSIFRTLALVFNTAVVRLLYSLITTSFGRKIIWRWFMILENVCTYVFFHPNSCG